MSTVLKTELVSHIMTVLLTPEALLQLSENAAISRRLCFVPADTFVLYIRVCVCFIIGCLVGLCLAVRAVLHNWS